jgi:hypothetical protein
MVNNQSITILIRIELVHKSLQRNVYDVIVRVLLQQQSSFEGERVDMDDTMRSSKFIQITKEY